MCDKNNLGNGSCLAKVLEKIIMLQQINGENLSGCDKPFLGNTSLLANTRPVNLYSCCNSSIWTMPYDYNNQTGTSSFFRIESLNDTCATFRILILNDNDTYTATNNFFMINLNCIGSIKCLGDTLISNI